MAVTCWNAAAAVALSVALPLMMSSLHGCGGGGNSKPQPPPAQPPKVKVDIYVEAGAPESQLFVLGPLNAAAATPGISDIMNLNMYAFGNAYYETEKDICGTPNVTAYSWGLWPEGYNDTYRACWNQKCGKGSSQPVVPGAGCFVSGPYCQHGASACTVNLLQMCGKFYNHSFVDYMPFAVCMESSYGTLLSAAQSHSGVIPNTTFLSGIVKECVKGTQLDAAKVLDCFDTDVFHTVMQDTAMQTVQHTQTPWVMVTNSTGAPMVFTGDFTNTAFLLDIVCKAWEFNGGEVSLVKECKQASTEVAV